MNNSSIPAAKLSIPLPKPPPNQGTGSDDIGLQKQRTVSLRFKVEGTATGDRKQVPYEEGTGVRDLNAYVYDDRLVVGSWNRPVKESGGQETWLETPNIKADTWHRLTLVIDGDASQLWKQAGGIGLGGVNGGSREL